MTIITMASRTEWSSSFGLIERTVRVGLGVVAAPGCILIVIYLNAT